MLRLTDPSDRALYIVMVILLALPGFVSGAGWLWVACSWIASLFVHRWLCKIYGNNFLIHAFLIAGILALNAAFLYRFLAM